jgi:hypothetical protein
MVAMDVGTGIVAQRAVISELFNAVAGVARVEGRSSVSPGLLLPASQRDLAAVATAVSNAGSIAHSAGNTHLAGELAGTTDAILGAMATIDRQTPPQWSTLLVDLDGIHRSLQMAADHVISGVETFPRPLAEEQLDAIRAAAGRQIDRDRAKEFVRSAYVRSVGART